MLSVKTVTLAEALLAEPDQHRDVAVHRELGVLPRMPRSKAAFPRSNISRSSGLRRWRSTALHDHVHVFRIKFQIEAYALGQFSRGECGAAAK